MTGWFGLVLLQRESRDACADIHSCICYVGNSFRIKTGELMDFFKEIVVLRLSPHPKEKLKAQQIGTG